MYSGKLESKGVAAVAGGDVMAPEAGGAGKGQQRRDANGDFVNTSPSDPPGAVYEPPANTRGAAPNRRIINRQVSLSPVDIAIFCKSATIMSIQETVFRFTGSAWYQTSKKVLLVFLCQRTCTHTRAVRHNTTRDSLRKEGCGSLAVLFVDSN